MVNRQDLADIDERVTGELVNLKQDMEERLREVDSKISNQQINDAVTKKLEEFEAK